MNLKKNKVGSSAQKRLLFLMNDNLVLCLEDNEKAYLVDKKEEPIQVRTCNELIKHGMIRVVESQKLGDVLQMYVKITQSGRNYCEKAQKRNGSKKD